MKRISVSLIIVLSVFIGGAGLMPSVVLAAKSDNCHQTSGFLEFPTWYEYLEIGQKGNDPCAIVGPTESNGEFSLQKALPRIILAIIEILLRVAGILAVGYVIFGGFKYMTSQGEPDATKQAQKAVINALIGLTITILATTIVGFVGGKVWL